MLAWLRNFFLGKPLETHQVSRERLSNPQGLAIFASDPLSSSAYATDEILLALIVAGAGALALSVPIAIAITGLILVVAISYRQTIHAYPQGGGGYSVAKDNFGESPALMVAASLLIEYVLTSAVSISACVAALTSAFPALLPQRIWIALGMLIFLLWGNLRGVRASGRIFAAPTYAYIVSIFGLIGYGAWRFFSNTFPEVPVVETATKPLIEPIGLFLILRAFASGCTALTGIEATASGVQAFRPPEAKNAANTLTAMALILMVLFLGVTILASALNIVPQTDSTVISQIGEKLVGRTPFYFIIQFATALILLLAANTPFSGFPRVGSILAKDGYFPRQFAQLGSRLVYSGGIWTLALAAASLLVVFRADTHRLIPLYAVGVFFVFTVSQFGMVRHWLKKHTHRLHRLNIAINLVGGSLTAMVFATVLLTKLRYGAWILIPAMLAIILAMRTIRAHYASVARQLSLANPLPKIPEEKTVIILVSGVHQGTLKAVEFVKLLNPAHVKAVHVAIDPDAVDTICKKWKQFVPDIPLDVVESPYRDLLEPLIGYVEKMLAKWEHDTVIVAVPEFIPTRWWHHFLHHRTAKYIQDALEHREDVIIVDVPYRLKDEEPYKLRSFLWLALVESAKNSGRIALWLAKGIIALPRLTLGRTRRN